MQVFTTKLFQREEKYQRDFNGKECFASGKATEGTKINSR